MADTINFEILEDGTITVRTSAVSSANHMNADELMKSLDTMMGGKVSIIKDPDAKAGIHHHHHNHAHAGGHSHDGGHSFHHH